MTALPVQSRCALGVGECQKGHAGLTAPMATWQGMESARSASGRAVSRRWLLVAAGAAALVGAVPLRDALPVASGSTPATDLRRRILGSAVQPWVGLAEATLDVIKEFGADGINGDTMLGIEHDFLEASNKVQHPVALQPEVGFRELDIARAAVLLGEEFLPA